MIIINNKHKNYSLPIVMSCRTLIGLPPLGYRWVSDLQNDKTRDETSKKTKRTQTKNVQNRREKSTGCFAWCLLFFFLQSKNKKVYRYYCSDRNLYILLCTYYFANSTSITTFQIKCGNNY